MAAVKEKSFKISVIAKDFGMKAKDLFEYLNANGMDIKTQSSSLSEADMSLALVLLFKNKEIKQIGAYIFGETMIPRVSKKIEKKKKEEEPKAVKEEKPSEKAKEEKAPLKAAKDEGAKKADLPKKPAAKSDVKSPAKDEKAPKTNTKVQNTQKTEKIQNQPESKNQEKAKRPEKKKQPAQARQTERIERVSKKEASSISKQALDASSRTSERGKVRIVDTRSSDVDLSKYDEKLDKYQSDRDYGHSKQKLKKQNKRQDSKDQRNKEREAMEKIKRAKEMAKKQVLSVALPDEITVSELASRLKAKVGDIVKKLMGLGVMAGINDVVDYDTAYLISEEMGAKITKETKVNIEENLFTQEEDKEEDLITRAPVVCVMGHVDHGKTSLLDAIRNTSVTSGEAGGITQAIGAYTVSTPNGDITFLDTPGHEAFTAMRARGAKSTDIAILVVAGDDGIMPQTVEAINHAKAANVDIIVAINKMDKPQSNAEAVKQELTKYDLVPEEWGGDIMCVPVSAVTKQGIDELLEDVLLIAEVKEFKANPKRRAKGLVIESKLDKGRGPVATVLVQNGTLHAGDTVIAGTAVGRVRAMKDDKGKEIKDAGPSIPVEIIGLSEVPDAGDEFNSVENEKMARELADQRREKAKNEEFKAKANVSLDDLFAQISEGYKCLNIIVKADVNGSAEAVKASLEKLSNEEVKVKCIHTAVGGITESDVSLASASDAIIVGFNVRPDRNALDKASKENVEIKTYRIIYECIEEITAAMKGMLAPTYEEHLLGHAEVRQTIHVPNVGTIAGSYILDGKVTRNALIRVIRDGVIIAEDKIKSLRRFKDDVKEVATGYECGIGLDKFNDIRELDQLEAFEMVEVKR